MLRERIDLLLVKRGLVQSRARAQDEIKAGHVLADGKVVAKSGELIASDADITIEQQNPFVSRAALKLAHALDHFNIEVSDKIVLDIGASTGGFTQVCLGRGAKRVYAVDVGHRQLAPLLREEARVVALEDTDIRHLTRAEIGEPIDLIVCDVSFIGLEKALTPALDLAAESAVVIALIKPQFEAGPGKVGKGGIIKDERVQEEIVTRIRDWLGEQRGWRVLGVTESPIEGGDGNKEFLIAAWRG
jgi:23S rRNA (cytidine1920-2'-O)/16S rRNA (cytidine1409-2'-O)-methyltransferase